MKSFVKDLCETVQARVVIFGMQVDDDVLYCGIANQPSPAYSSLYLSDFLSFHTLNNESFVKDFCETVQARVVIFGMQVDNDVLYSGIANQPSSAYSFLYLSIFSFSLLFSSKISPQLYRVETSYFGIHVHDDKLYCGIENGPSPICSSLYLFFFSFSPDFSSKISLQPFKIETSNLVYRFTTTSCDVGLKMDILLFVLPCMFLYLYIFRQRYQPYALKSAKAGV